MGIYTPPYCLAQPTASIEILKPVGFHQTTKSQYLDYLIFFIKNTLISFSTHMLVPFKQPGQLGVGDGGW